MKKFYCLLFGIDPDIYDRLTTASKKNYGLKLIAMFISVLISNIVAIEISSTVLNISDNKIIALVCIIWSLIIVLMDIMLFRKAFPNSIRISFSFCIISISVISSFNYIVNKDIENKRDQTNFNKKLTLDVDYEKEKKERFKELTEKKLEQIDYHNSNCIPESLKMNEAGPVYERKHRHCLTLLDESKNLEEKLIAEEVPFKTKFDEKTENLKKITSLGFFEKTTATLKEISSDGTKIFLFVIVLVALLLLESAAFFASFSIKDDEVNKLNELKNEFVKISNEVENILLRNHIYELTKKKKVTPYFEAKIDKILKDGI